MDENRDTAEVSLSDGDGELTPKQAAAILAETKRRAGHLFDAWPPFLLLTGAAMFLVAYGAMWWSARDQAPFLGPSLGALAIFYGCIVVWGIVASAVVRRATSGVSGPSYQRRRRYRAGYGSILLADYALQGALYHAGASHAIVYGIMPTTVPFFLGGAAVVTMGVMREERQIVALGVGLLAVGVAGAYAGAAASWLICGIALSVTLAGFAAVRFSRQRA